MDDAYLDQTIQTCRTQANWHYEQYQKFSCYIQHYTKLKQDRKQREEKRKKKKKRKKRRESEECMEEEREIEVDQGFVDFLKQSAEHRRQRDEAKRFETKEDGTMEEVECVEYIDVLEKGPEGSVLPPTACNRQQVYDQQYGEASGTTILSLETAVQWKFNKFRDTNRPQMWPALPLRL